MPAVSPAGIKIAAVVSTPEDHFAAGPDCRRNVPGSRRVGGAGGCPTVRAGMVPPAGVQIGGAASAATPDDHFAASPNCRVAGPSAGRVGEARWSPRVLRTATKRTSYYGKRVVLPPLLCDCDGHFRLRISEPQLFELSVKSCVSVQPYE
jgi:hypothetical protein